MTRTVRWPSGLNRYVRFRGVVDNADVLYFLPNLTTLALQ